MSTNEAQQSERVPMLSSTEEAASAVPAAAVAVTVESAKAVSK